MHLRRLSIIACSVYILVGCSAEVDPAIVEEFESRNVEQAISLHKDLQTIPEDKLFYYFGDQKIPLEMRIEGEEIYFQEEDQSHKLLVSQQFFVQFLQSASAEQLGHVQQEMQLHLVETYPHNPSSILLSTTKQSPKLDAIQMSHLLMETYPDVVDYAMPHFKRVE